MKFNIFFSVLQIFLIFSCSTINNDIYVGTKAARHSISEFPSKENWVSLTKVSTKSFGFNAKNSLLWSIGTYSNDEIILNFPGKDTTGIKHNKIDFNEVYLNYFDKKKMNIYLLLEPNNSSASLNEIVKEILLKYRGHHSVKGVCIDFSWINNKVSSAMLSTLLKEVKNIKNSYVLIVKDWDIQKLDFCNEEIIYLFNSEGIKNIDDISKNLYLWFKKFYPNPIGIELGYRIDDYWKEPGNTPINIFNKLSNNSLILKMFIWSETTYFDVTDNQ